MRRGATYFLPRSHLSPYRRTEDCAHGEAFAEGFRPSDLFGRQRKSASLRSLRSLAVVD